MVQRTTARHGFTLLEVLLVIVILGMLAGTGAILLMGTRESAQIDTTRSKIDTVMHALELYHNRLQEYPDEEQGLRALLEKPEDEAKAQKWRAPFVKSLDALKDAWGNEFKYLREDDPETGRTKVRVYSFGPNKEDDNGEGDDIKDRNWAAEAEAEAV
jgi:general secretion pathway protein G